MFSCFVLVQFFMCVWCNLFLFLPLTRFPSWQVGAQGKSSCAPSIAATLCPSHLNKGARGLGLPLSHPQGRKARTCGGKWYSMLPGSSHIKSAELGTGGGDAVGLGIHLPQHPTRISLSSGPELTENLRAPRAPPRHHPAQQTPLPI